MPIEKIKKRTQEVVDFDRTRIELAMKKAFIATRVAVSDEEIAAITDKVIEDLERRFVESFPGVEDIQDVVERKLSEAGHFEVAKAYILYRKERERVRLARRRELLERLRRSEITVRKRNGAAVPFDLSELEANVQRYASLFPEAKIDVAEIVDETCLNLYDGVSASEINRAIVLVLRARIERDPIYSQLAARVLWNDLRKEVLGVDEFAAEFADRYRQHLRRAIESGVRARRIDPRLLEFDLERLSASLAPERDSLFEFIGAQTLYDRYLLRDHEQRILELPQHFWMRIAMGLALNEADREGRAIEFYDLMSKLLYVPSTPTLFHAGTTHPQMSSCYITTVEDDLTHIFKCIGDNAQLSKWSGGVGNDWTNIRGTGALIRSTNVPSQGVVPFLKIVDATTAAINRSGKRRGATCVYLETWHYDIEDFLELRKNTGDERRRTHDTNTANWIPDLFMKRVIEDGQWTLLSPDEAPDLHHTYGRDFERRYLEYERRAERGEMRLWRQVRARDLWRKMINMLFETGHPWITFKDPCNIRSPQDHAGVVHSSNLCTEITLNTSREETAVCNLGSINLARHVAGRAIDWAQLERTVKTAMRMLDNVIDLNFYPTVEAERANLKHRPVGLGIMGLQDVLYMLDCDFESERAVALSDELMEFISYHAILASSELARERGAYESYRGSKWDRGLFPLDTLELLERERGIETGVEKRARMDWEPVREHVRQFGMRNSNCLAIAPTATIANIAGCFPSIEPIYKNLYVKSNVSGEFTVINRYLVEDLKRLGLWDEEMVRRLKQHDGSIQSFTDLPPRLRRKYKEAFEMDALWIIRHAAHRGKWIDQSQSVNIFTASTSGRYISDIYITAWKMGLKTTYYLRTLAASGIEKSTLDAASAHAVPETTEEVPSETTSAVCSLDEGCEVCQ
ncbi:MAG: ribonucleoside-diphosphate reductase subunit alpha [Pyrinomonas methylaliphatogenes]|nr:ribonucleoside-diphosphate reductase subunit alpha [Pyrinomonas methylaliphatogenes]